MEANNINNYTSPYYDEEETKKELQKEAEKKQLRKDVNKVGLSMILFFGLGIVVLNVALILLFKYPFRDMAYEMKSLIASISEIVLMDIIIVFAAVFFLSRTSTQKFKIRDIYRKPQMPFKNIMKWVCIGLSAGYITSFLFTKLFSILEQIIGRQLTPVTPSIDATWYSIVINLFSIIIVAPFCEETLFRGGMAWSLRKYGGWFAAIVSGLMFGLAHANYSQMFFAMTLGIINTLLIFKSKSIWPSIIVHFSFNLLGGISTFISTQVDFTKLENALSSPQDNLDYIVNNVGYVLLLGLVSITILVVVILGLVFLGKERSLSNYYKRQGYTEYIAPKGEVSLTTKEKWGVFFTSPAMVICLGLFLSYTVARALWS